jgi:hypothetical protein
MTWTSKLPMGYRSYVPTGQSIPQSVWIEHLIFQTAETVLFMELTTDLASSLIVYTATHQVYRTLELCRDMSFTYARYDHAFVTRSHGGCRKFVSYEDAYSRSKEKRAERADEVTTVSEYHPILQSTVSLCT